MVAVLDLYEFCWLYNEVRSIPVVFMGRQNIMHVCWPVRGLTAGVICFVDLLRVFCNLWLDLSQSNLTCECCLCPEYGVRSRVVGMSTLLLDLCLYAPCG